MSLKKPTPLIAELQRNASEIIDNRLYFSSASDHVPETLDDLYAFTVDDSLVYENFCLDFGPLNLAKTVRFCVMLDKILKDAQHAHKKVFFYSCKMKQYSSNAAVLICAFQLLFLNRTAEQAYQRVMNRETTFQSFHDASFFPCPYQLVVRDCVQGLAKAKQLGFFNWPDFDVTEYEHYIDLVHGDLNWLVEGKFCAFAGPFDKRKHYGNNYYSTVPADYIDYFKRKNVTAVIRLNKACYDAKEFTDAGINHYHLFYTDGSNPPEKILDRFIKICEQEKGAIAVHCKAGLGRTGTCIGMYLMKHFDITAKELIGWFRIVRPGTVIGPQQDYLSKHEPRMKALRIKIQKEALKKQKKSNASPSAASKIKKKPSKAEVEEGQKETQGDVLNRLKAIHHLPDHHQNQDSNNAAMGADPKSNDDAAPVKKA